MELKPGYKQTEVGVIPEDWDVSPLNGKVTITHGFAFSSRHFSAHGPFRLTTPGHFFERGGFRDIGEKQKYFTGAVPTDYILGSGDMIVAMTEQSDGLLGSAAFIPGTDNYLHNQRLGRVRTLSPEVDPGYLYYIFNSTRYRTKVRETAAGTKVKHTSPGKLLEIPVQIAPFAEQRAIAQALKDLEALLDSLEDLIAKKQNIKQAAMQELLTGKRRLPGFEGEWEVKRLGEIATISMGRTPSRAKQEFWGSGHTWLSIADMKSKIVTDSKEAITDSAASTMSIIPKGTLLMSFKLSIGRLCFAGRDLFTNEAICSFNALDASGEFLYYVLGRTDFSLYGKQAVKGYTLNKESLQSVEVRLPLREEQDAIASVLSSIDDEILILEERREKALSIKQGMMQQLLTGKIRLT
ncbi:MAG: restriction endonuclease subunit S [Synechococcaceae cyanobacterium ELA739]